MHGAAQDRDDAPGNDRGPAPAAAATQPEIPDATTAPDPDLDLDGDVSLEVRVAALGDVALVDRPDAFAALDAAIVSELRAIEDL